MQQGIIAIGLVFFMFLLLSWIVIWLMARAENSRSRGAAIFLKTLGACLLPLFLLIIMIAWEAYKDNPVSLPAGALTFSICVSLLAVSYVVHFEYAHETKTRRMPLQHENFSVRLLFWICDQLYAVFGSSFAQLFSSYAMLILVFPTTWTILELIFRPSISNILHPFLVLAISILVVLGAQLCDGRIDDIAPQKLLLFGSLMGVGYWHVYPWLQWTLFQEGTSGLVGCFFITAALVTMLQDMREQYLSRVNTLAATDIALPAAAGSDE